ncbi:MAG: UDP-galactopyranose mutase [Elusimicrobiota bacterium]
MSKIYDFLIVGAGFSGSVCAQCLKEAGFKVIVIDKKSHIGGHSYDCYDENGVLIHKYGPHYFRTDDEGVRQYLSRFTEWREHRYKVRVSIRGKLYTFPINLDTLNEFFGINLKSEAEAKIFLEAERVNIENPKNAEEQVLSLAGKRIYESFFKNYTKKQWDCDPKDLDASVTARIPIRYDRNDDYLKEKFQAMPLEGYFRLFENLLSDIEVILNADYKDFKNKIRYENLIYTGAIDEFFGYKYGKLPYRSLKFEINRYNEEYIQSFGQINYPGEEPYTRSVEIKHVTGQKVPGTTVIKEYPTWDGEPYYPVPSFNNEILYKKYADESKKLKNVYFLGRLAEYKYLNMDWVVKKALILSEEIIK